MNGSWNNPWKLTAIGMALVGATALVTGLVVANWSGADRDAKPVEAKATMQTASTAVRAAAPAPQPHRVAPAPAAPAVPTESAINACNQYAQQSTRDKTLEVVKDAAVGALAGAAVGAGGGAIADGGKSAGKGAAIGGVLGAGGGTLYGLHENKKHDEQYRAAYAQCMHSRGYSR